jgi:MYXO-CTERM domain-containing protein
MNPNPAIRRCLLIAALLGLSFGLSAPAAVLIHTFTSGFVNGGVIPDGELTGWQDTRALSDVPAGLTIGDLDVTLDIAGGYNGDLYGWLQHDTGFVVLLNRAGKTAGNAAGYGDPGFSLVFDDAPANADLHLYQTFGPTYNGAGQVLGTWRSDARTVHPSIVRDTDPRTATLASFTTLDPNGTWTLFLADVSFGEQSTLDAWGLRIALVPETSPVIAAGLLALLALAHLLRRRRNHRTPEG